MRSLPAWNLEKALGFAAATLLATACYSTPPGEEEDAGADSSGDPSGPGDSSTSDDPATTSATGADDTDTDATTDGDDTSSGGEPQVQATFDAAPDFVGLPTAVDGSASMDEAGGAIDFEWSVVSVPDGSAITTESLSSTTNEMIDFVGDLGGDYELSLTITAADGRSDTITEVVTVPTYAIPYLQVAGNDMNFSRVPAMVQSDGTGQRAAACVVNEQTTSIDSWLSDFFQIGTFAIGTFVAQTPDQRTILARYPGDINEPPMPGMELATQDTSCDGTPPGLVDTGMMMPRFRRAGDRIVSWEFEEFTAPDGSITQDIGVITVNPDGTGRHRVRTVEGQEPGIVAPSWIDDDTVMWMEHLGGTASSTMRLYSAPDEENGFDNLIERETLLSCDGGQADGFELVLAAQRVPAGLLVSVLEGGDIRPWLLHPLPDDTYECSTTSMLNQPLTPFFTRSSVAVSPDGTEALVVEPLETFDFDMGTSNIYRLPTDGSAPPTLFAGNDGRGNLEPRWAAGGRQIYWMSTEWQEVDTTGNGTPDSARPISTTIVMTNADGSGPVYDIHTVESGGGLFRTLTLGNPDFVINCAVSNESRGGAWWMALGLFGLVASRRRRRR